MGRTSAAGEAGGDHRTSPEAHNREEARNRVEEAEASREAEDRKEEEGRAPAVQTCSKSDPRDLYLMSKILELVAQRHQMVGGSLALLYFPGFQWGETGQSCRMGRFSVRLSVHPSIRLSVPPSGPSSQS